MYLTPGMSQTDCSSSAKEKIQVFTRKGVKIYFPNLVPYRSKEITLVTWENNHIDLTTEEGPVLSESPGQMQFIQI